MSNAAVLPAKQSRIAPNADGSKTGAFVPLDLDNPKNRADVAEELRTNETFSEFVSDVCDAVYNSGHNERIARRRKTVQLRNYICGNYLGYVDSNGKWVDKSTDAGADSLYYDPETATYIDVLVASIAKSKPVWKVVPTADEKINLREAATVAQLVFDEAVTTISTAKKSHREIKLNLLAGGETYRYTYFNPNKPNSGYNKTVYESKVSEKQKQHAVCLDCHTNFNPDTEGVGVDTPDIPTDKDYIPEQTVAETAPVSAGDALVPCPNCGSASTSVFKRNQVVLNIKKGEEFVNVGDTESDFVDPLEMTVLGEVDDISSALAVQRNRMMFRCLLEETFKDAKLAGGGAERDNRSDDPFATDEDENKNGSSDSKGSRNQFEKLRFQETWLHPAVYASRTFEQDTTLKSGRVIKKGTKYTKLFPDGMAVARSGKELLNIYNQAAGSCWVHAVNSVGEGFHGIGEWDLTPLQDQLNNVTSMKMNSLMHDSTSPIIYRSKYVTGAQLKNKVGLTIPVSEEFEDGQNLNEIATRLPASGGVPEAYELANDLRQRMTARGGAMTQDGGGVGAEDASRNTATGYRLWYEHTLGRRAPMLALRAEMIAEQGYQILEMKQKYMCAKMFEFAESEASGDAVKWFMDANIRRDFRIEITPDSWMPQSDIQKKADFQEFLTIIAPIIALKPELIDSILEKISENYSAFDLTEHHADTTEGQIRLEKIIDIAEFAEQQSNERGLPVVSEEIAMDGQTTTLVPNPLLIDLVLKQSARDLKVVHAKVSEEADPFADFPLDVMFDDHQQLEQTYTDYLKTAQGRRASLFVRAVIQRIALLHRKAGFEMMKQMQMLELAAQQPQLEAAQIASDEQHQQQMQQNEDVHQQQMVQSGEQQIQQAAIGGLQQAVEADMNEGEDE